MPNYCSNVECDDCMSEMEAELRAATTPHDEDACLDDPCAECEENREMTKFTVKNSPEWKEVAGAVIDATNFAAWARTGVQSKTVLKDGVRFRVTMEREVSDGRRATILRLFIDGQGGQAAEARGTDAADADTVRLFTDRIMRHALEVRAKEAV
jgi:hypothetical protein